MAQEKILAFTIKAEGTEKTILSINNLNKANKELRAELRALDLETVQGQKRRKEINTQVEANTEIIKANSDSYTQQKMNIGNYKSALEGLPAPLQSTIAMVQRLSKAFLALLKNPIVLLITAIVTALAILVKAFKSTDDGGTKVEAMMKAVGVAINIVWQRVQLLASALANLFKGDFVAASEDFSKAIAKSEVSMRDAMRTAYEYVIAIDRLNDAETNYISQRAKNANMIAKLEAMAMDAMLDPDKRRQALKQALAIGEQQVKDEKKIADERYQITVKQFADQYSLTTEQLDKLVKADSDTADKLLANDKALRDARSSMGDIKYKELEELYAKTIDMDTRFYEENRRNFWRLGTLEKEIFDQRAKMREALMKEDERISKLQKAEQDRLIKQKAEELKIEQDFMKQVNDEWQKMEEDRLKRALEVIKFNAETETDIRILSIENEWDRRAEIIRVQYEQELQWAMEHGADLEAVKEKYRLIEEENEKDKSRRLGDYRKEAINATMEIAAGLLDIKSRQLDQEMQKELSNVNLTEQQKEGIRKKYAKEQQKIDVKQSIIAGAQAVLNALLTKPFIPAGLIAGATAVAMTGIQIAQIKAQKYESGGKVQPGHELPGSSPHEDNTLALVKPGEVILNERQQALLGGASTFRKIGVKGFAEGGLVGGIRMPQLNLTNDNKELAKELAKLINDKKVVLNINELNYRQGELTQINTSSGL